MTARDPVIIAAAPTGAYKSAADHPHLPLSPGAIADEAARCVEAGASMLHLHVRDAAGRHTLDPRAYRQAVEAVRDRVGDDLLIQLTSEQARLYDSAAQIDAIDAIEGEFMSIALAEVAASGSDADLARLAALADRLEHRGTRVQWILYSADQLDEFRRLQAVGVLPDAPAPLLFVLGRYLRDRSSEPEDLAPFLDGPVDGDPWMVCAFGAREIECMRHAAAQGGHIRVGFENNTVRPDGALLASTAESVALARDALVADGRQIADAAAARGILLGR